MNLEHLAEGEPVLRRVLMFGNIIEVNFLKKRIDLEGRARISTRAGEHDSVDVFFPANADRKPIYSDSYLWNYYAQENELWIGSRHNRDNNCHQKLEALKEGEHIRADNENSYLAKVGNAIGEGAITIEGGIGSVDEEIIPLEVFENVFGIPFEYES